MSYNLPKRALVKQDAQAITAKPDVPRSTFIVEKNRLTAFNAGDLIPFHVQEILPGDHMRYDVTAYVRMATPLFPVFSNQRVDFHFFFVPNRIIWSNWARFMGQQTTPAQSIDVAHPLRTIGNPAVGSLDDHFGIPPRNYPSSINVNALPYRAYNRIWDSWFRDQDLQDGAALVTGDGVDATAYSLLKRNKFHDYFTSARPWPQKFDSPFLPLDGIAPVYGIGSDTAAAAGPFAVTDTNALAQSYGLAYRSSVESVWAQVGTSAANPGVYADLAAATGISINTFRQAIMLQSLLEKDARGGTRYVEILLQHFGVRSPDYRLQRPEYIGGGSMPINVTPVAQTAPSTNVTVGALGGAATATGPASASYAATEHGWIIGLVSVRTELAYQQGIHRQWFRVTRYDYYWPSLSGLGEQAILNREIYAQGAAADIEVFGYQERWHEYRTMYSDVTGRMRSGVTATLDAWHLTEQFSALPVLGNTFVRESAPMARVLAAGTQITTDQWQYFADILIRAKMTRPIPMFGTPATLGRF